MPIGTVPLKSLDEGPLWDLTNFIDQSHFYNGRNHLRIMDFEPTMIPAC